MKNDIEKLQSMIGKTIMHNTRNYKLLYFENDGAVIRLATDKKLFKFENGDLAKFLKEISETDETGLELYKETSKGLSIVSDMQGLISDTIKKIQTDAKYIPQAREINKNVNSMIALARTQIEMIKLMEGKR